jgi:uncharacterized protein (DUF934 family)
MALLRDGAIVEDPWTSVVDAEEIPSSGAIVVSFAQWEANRAALGGRKDPLGIRLAPDQSPALIADDLPRFQLCALEFPAFRDGRAYSHARLLRERYGFEGEVRAVGDVLMEQLHFMQRAGFDAYEVDSETAVEDWKTVQADMDVFYQPTADGRRTAMRLRND